MPLFLASFNATRGSVLTYFLDVFPADQPIKLITFSHFYYIPSPFSGTKKWLLWRAQMLSPETCSPQQGSHRRMALTWLLGSPRAASPEKTQREKITTSENSFPESKMSAASATCLCLSRGIYVLTRFMVCR